MAQTFDFDIGSVVGPPGATGNGISGIELLSTSGLQKTYRINMTNETHFDFVVTDGNGISGASFDADTNELTITFDNGTSFTTPSLKGNPGDNGYSPAVTIDTITGGHRVTITDKDHPTMDGASDAGSVSYDPSATYQSGTVGAELQHQSRQISDVEENQIPELKNAINQLESEVVTDVTVTGTDVTIVAQANKRYLCGTVSTIAVTPCATGAFDLIFTSGSSAAILTIPSTVKWQDSSFDPTALDTDTIYEISVADGTLGLVAKWT